MAQSKNVFTATDSNFETEVLQSKLPVLVDFWAEWCGPCRMLGPTIEAIADEYAGRVRVYKMDIDSNHDTPPKYHVRGIPTVILYKDGKVVEQLVGNMPKDAFVQLLNKNI